MLQVFSVRPGIRDLDSLKVAHFRAILRLICWQISPKRVKRSSKNPLMAENRLERAVIAFVSIAAAAAFHRHNSTFSLDDAAIYERVVRNILIHGSWTFNLEAPTNPLTSFLYPLLVAAAAWPMPSVPLHQISAALDCCFLALAAFFSGAYFARQGSLTAAFLAAVFVPFGLPIGNFLGMETNLLMAALAGLLFFDQSARIRPALTAILPLIRPEGVVFLGVELFRAWFAGRKRQEKPFSLRLLKPALLLILPLLASLLFNYSLFGIPLPRSVLYKAEQGISGFLGYREVLFRLLLQGYQTSPEKAALACLVLCGFIVAIKRKDRAFLSLSAGIFLWQAGLYICNVAFYDWYFTPLHFLFLLAALQVCGMLGPLAQLTALPRKFPRQTEAVRCLVACAAGCTAFFVKWPAGQRPVESRQLAYYGAARFITEQLARPKAKVAVIEAGHFGAALPSERFEILDLCGLTSKNPAYYARNFNDRFFCREKPDYFVVNQQTKTLPNFSSESLVLDDVRVEVNRSGGFYASLWLHAMGVVMDPRFSRHYALIAQRTSAGFPGAVLIYRRILDAVCTSTASADGRNLIQKTQTSRDLARGLGGKNLIDNNLGHGWVSGDMAPQWAELYFKRSIFLKQLNLISYQTPAGKVVFTVSGKTKDGTESFKPISVELLLSDADEIRLHLGRRPVNRLRITTQSSPSWVAWREIIPYEAGEPP